MQMTETELNWYTAFIFFCGVVVGLALGVNLALGG